jgi:branched-chain amino acid transport system permease protein
MDVLKRFGLYAVVAALAFIPYFISNEYIVHSVLCKVCIYIIVVAGLDLVVGYSGDVSAGHAGLFAVGAYTAAILMWKFKVDFTLCMVAGTALAAVFGVILGVPALRLRGPYLAVCTIAFGLIIQTVINEAVPLTQGSSGIKQIPRLIYGPINFEGNNLFYLVYPVMILCLIVVSHIVHSYWGRAFEALKESPVAAGCSGVSRYRTKLSAFVLSAAFAGLAGTLFCHVDKYIGPPTFSFELSVLFLIMLIFGGTRSIIGNCLGVLVAVILPDLFNDINDYRLMIFGGLLLFTLYFMPSGIVGLLRIILSKVGLMSKSHPRLGIPARALAGIDIGDVKAVHLRPDMDAAKGESLLVTKELTIKFGGLTAVNKLDLTVTRGQIHALIGPNGSGKSTTVNLLSGIYQPTSGEILFRGQPVRGSADQISRSGIARTFQNVALFGDMSVLDNVMVGLHHSFSGGLLPVVFRTPNARRQAAGALARASALLEFVGLGNLATEQARNLPYGKQRLLEIARALGSDPSLLLLDEPAAGLTKSEIGEMDAIIRKVRDAGVSVLLIEHHMDLVMAVSDEITVLDFGQKIANGTPEQIQADDRVINAYLGTSGSGHTLSAAAH